VKTHVAGQVGGPDREERRAHHLREHFAEGAFGLPGPVDVEAGALLQHGEEERQALHVVPMQMREQRGAVEQAVARQPVGTEAGAEVEDDRWLVG